MPSPYDPTPPHLTALGDSRAAIIRMTAAAVGIVGLVVGLLVYSAAQETPNTVYQQVDMAATSPGGVYADSSASLWVDASSPGATVRLDGDSVGMVPAWVTDVEAGLRRVEVVTQNGLTVVDTTIWIETGAVADLDLTNRPARREGPTAASRDRPLAPSSDAPTGSIRVTSTPSGATVVIGGRRVGTTPLSIRGIASGRHDVSVRQSGYESVTRSVDVREGGVFETAVDLRRAGGAPQASRPAPPVQESEPPTAPAPPRPLPTRTPQAQPAASETGEVEVLVRPWGQIVIDGSIHQRESDVLYRTALSPGTHRVVVSHPELGSQERTVTVTPGSSVRLEIDLSRDGG